MQNPMLSCFFPTTVVFIDEHSSYLEALLSGIDLQHIIPKMFSEPMDALQFINQQASPLWQSFVPSFSNLPLHHAGFDQNIREFHQKLLYGKHNRFHELSVVVCDYTLSQKNELNIFKQLNNKEIKTIALTGEANEQLATDAFNNGFIDQHLLKNNRHFIESLNQIIFSLQQEYIMRATSLMIDNIILSKQPSACSLSDPAFMSLFEDIVKKHHIVEYYLLNEQGSYLLLDQKGRPYFLAVMDEAAREAYLQFAIDEKAQQTITAALKSKQAIPFFYSDADFAARPNDWLRLLHPAQKCEGENTYYYSLIPPAEIETPIIQAEQAYQYFLEHTHI